MMQISVIVPVFNESASLATLYERLDKVFSKFEITQEILFIDDGSKDDSWNVISTMAESHPHVRGIRLSRNFGKEAAIAAGLERTTSDAAIVMDADLQHPPEITEDLIRIWLEKKPAVVDAVKRERGAESEIARACAESYYWIMTKLTRQNFRGASDFKLLDRRAIDRWLELKERSVFFRGMVAWLGLPREKVEFEVADRSDKQSGWTVYALINLALTSITAFSAFPLRLITIFGLILAAAAFFLALQTLFMKFSGKAFDGFTTVILIQLFLGSSIVVSLGIIGEYIARIYDEVKARPRYLIDEDTKA